MQALLLQRRVKGHAGVLEPSPAQPRASGSLDLCYQRRKGLHGSLGSVRAEQDVTLCLELAIP